MPASIVLCPNAPNEIILDVDGTIYFEFEIGDLRSQTLLPCWNQASSGELETFLRFPRGFSALDLLAT